eukprot:3164675-Prymnesium_polylepis.1
MCIRDSSIHTQQAQPRTAYRRGTDAARQRTRKPDQPDANGDDTSPATHAKNAVCSSTRSCAIRRSALIARRSVTVPNSHAQS